MIPACAASSSGPAQPETAAHGSADARRRTWLLNCDEPAIRLMTRRDVLGEQADEDAGQVLAGAKVTALLSGQRPTEGSASTRTASGPARTGGDSGLVSLAELAIPPARAARGRGCRSCPRLAGQPAAPRPAHRRARPRPRLHRGKRPGRPLPARPGRRPAGPLPGRIPDRLAMARRRMELRPGRHRAVLLPRVAGPGPGAARVRAGHRRSGRQGRGQPHRRAVPGPPDRQVF